MAVPFRVRVAVVLILYINFAEPAKELSQCYDELGNPKKCLCDFENPAFGLDVEATNTCGDDGPATFCIQSGASSSKSCFDCRQGDYPPSHLTDLQSYGNITWWQSGTMAEGLQYPNSVNLTLHLNKAYDITFVQIRFHSPRPDSFAIFKRTKTDGPWVPFQYYSADCRAVWGLEDRSYALGTDETAPLCTSEFSDISPLSGGSIAFATLEGRRSAIVDFDHSAALHEWVSATDIMIMLHRMNTFGDEHYGSEDVFRSYYYAISEIAIGARCKCNGHASKCDHITMPDGSPGRRCVCQHNTAGDDCERCADFYQDSKWKRATNNDAGECQPCNCNGFSTRCIFDEELWEKTGHGGHCIDCAENRDGPNCERCRDNYFLTEDGQCLPCYCNDIGSRSLQCNRGGKCDCKPGVTGDKCDTCAPDYYDFSSSGCKACNCLVAGSYGNQPSCDQTLGKCDCKQNVEGKECSSCKFGYFNLDEENAFGCTPCFCFGHSTVCESEPGYTKSFIESMFGRNSEKWTATERGLRSAKEVRYNAKSQDISVVSSGRDPAYFSAPDRFLGDQRASYNQEIQFKLKVGELGSDPATPSDIVLEGNNIVISQSIFGYGNPLPSTSDQVYKFVLHENPDFGWVPRLAAREFMSVLSNLTALKIRGTYAHKGVGFLDSFKMGTAVRGGAGKPANWIERCSCPEGYISQFCESCAPGYRHDPPGGGPFSVCIPCNCNNHTDSCDPDTGKCICQHNTGGNNCERCARGFYGNALAGTPNDCQPCPCPNQGACYQLHGHDTTVICLECPKGYTGARCDQCSDGFFGQIDPVTGTRTCTACECNSNVDVNAVNNCNRTTGECLKCIYNTAGFHCDQCLAGFFGDPLAPEKGDCKPCYCDPRGTEGGEDGGPFLCNQLTGQCQCKSNVTGAKCEVCKAGYFNIDSGKGCQPCNCNVTGSKGPGCDENGQCVCRTGVTGLQCDECERNQFGFSATGCQPCECDPFGSSDLQCNSTGHCPCLENVEGRHCDRCKENKYDRKSNCKDCPPCFNLVKDEVDRLRSNLRKLDAVLQKIIISPSSINDDNYQSKVEEVKERVEQLWYDAKRNVGDEALAEKLAGLKKMLDELNKSLDNISEDTEKAAIVVNDAKKNATEIEKTIQATKKDISDAKRYIDTEGRFALERARLRSQDTGQGNAQMSLIAHQARTIVKKQIKEAQETQEAAEKAVETCDEAYKLSLQVKEKQVNASRDLESLEEKITLVKTDVDSMNILANETLAKVNTAYQDVSSFAVEITNLQDPVVDASKLINDAELYREEALRLKGESNKIEENHLKDAAEVEVALWKSQSKLDDAEKLQQQLDALMAQADSARSRAIEAVKLGEKTFTDAQETLELLQHSDEQIQAGKEKAMAAIKTIPQIRTVLEEAKQKTDNAQEALADAESNAQKASAAALHAQNATAAEASEQTKRIRERAEKAKEDASKLKDEAESLGNHVQDTSLTLKDKSQRVDKFINFTREAKDKVASARTKADEVSREVDGAVGTLKKIVKDLEDLSDIDEDRLNLLEKRLQEIQRTFEDANFEEQVNILNNARILQDQQIKSYEEEMEKLKKEVDKVKAIHDALPDGCYNRPNLEQL
ncbi:Laminin B (Domain IV) [Nesidiocoris tenuis]|uniref:Laminin B (Domain IV) n=1 Tax=Nesidiocoris tenuis TaxID=355587 RepID=A0ABN7B750_9HEMI|nr:Laminin B (Domain IV) [Nesidiocoris tenuis]